jgi:hypothetical protein
MGGIIGSCGAYRRVQDEGVDLTRRSTIDFAGAGVTATDTGSKTLVTIPGGGSGGSDKGCRVYNSTAITIADSTTTTLTFDTESWDTDAMHSAAVNPERLTCKTAGKYLVGGNVFWDTNAAGYRGIQLFCSAPVGSVHALVYAPSAGAVIGNGLNASTVLDLAVNDYVELRVRQTSGGNLDVRNLVYYSPQFWAQRLA